MTTSTPPHLLGNYAPVPDEITVTDLPVTGNIPPQLSGWYLRNGPNPREAESAHWFLGDGMVHGIRLEDGRATAYRNRWVRTKRFLGTQDDDILTGGVANTHVVRHAGRILTLVESSFPYEITEELDTIGAYDFNGRLHTPMTAHPKICPTTGELHFFGYRHDEAPYVTYHRADAAGQLVVSQPVEVAAPTMMHDFCLTSRHVVFLDLPVLFDDSSENGMPYKWAPEYGARLGVLRRDDPSIPVRWFEIEPCYVFHTLNAHEDGDNLVLFVIRYDSLGDGVGLGAPASLWRWTIDLAAGTVREDQLDDRSSEFPRIDDRLAGLPAGFGHTSTGHGPSGGAIHRYNLTTGSVTSHEFGPDQVPGEAVFIGADDRPGGDGWLMSLVYDGISDRSDLVILDAEALTEPPVARIHLPRRVPAGFHGNWLPDDIGR